jgi:hypothetical protein
MSAPHKHAELMLEYAQDAAKTSEPWKLWESKFDCDDWETLGSNPTWLKSFEYRRKKLREWHPVGGEWFINQHDDEVEHWKMSTVDTRDAGLERPTQEQANKASIEMRKYNRLLALKDELCGYVDEGNWSYADKKQYYVYYDHYYKRYDCNSNNHAECISVYFSTKENAQKACDMLNSGEVVL